MAEFCLDCWNKLNGTNYTEKEVVTEVDLCEGCGQWKPVVVYVRPRGVRGWLADRWERIYRYLEYLARTHRGR